jgi:hypothetical protein
VDIVFFTFDHVIEWVSGANKAECSGDMIFKGGICYNVLVDGVICLRSDRIDDSASAVIVVDAIFSEEVQERLRWQEWVEVTNDFVDTANLCD